MNWVVKISSAPQNQSTADAISLSSLLLGLKGSFSRELFLTMCKCQRDV